VQKHFASSLREVGTVSTHAVAALYLLGRQSATKTVHFREQSKLFHKPMERLAYSFLGGIGGRLPGLPRKSGAAMASSSAVGGGRTDRVEGLDKSHTPPRKKNFAQAAGSGSPHFIGRSLCSCGMGKRYQAVDYALE